MATQRTYLDYNATAPLAPGVREAVCAAMDLAGNPSSVHKEGRAARALVEAAREKVAALVGAPARRVIFTSGATEAANLALTSHVVSPAGNVANTLIIAAGEHPCVIDGNRFAPEALLIAPLTAEGMLDLAKLERLLAQVPRRACMLALQVANNETGVIQPVKAAAALVHAHGGIVVCDAVQGVHRMDCGARALDADMVFFSSHKLGGPKGAGALVLLNESIEIAQPVLRGGGQERGARAGTENVPAIAGFGAASIAVVANRDMENTRLAGLRDQFESALQARFPGVTIFGANAPRLANTSAFAMSGMPAETMLIGLDLEGIAVSSGSACSSGKVRTSHVLEAMGVAPDLSRCALRVSVGTGTQTDDIEFALAALEKVAGRMTTRRVKSAA